MRLVRDFESGNLNLDRLNYAMITLIPKEPDATHLKKFRPISLINCSFKIFAKALNNRLIKVADRLICTNQTTFIKRRFILESVVAAHEIIHEIHRNKESGIILKLDYEKAYDRVSWTFIDDMLTSRGFGAKWRGWMKKVIQGVPFVLGSMMKIVAILNLERDLGKWTLYPPSCLIWLLIFSPGCCLKLLDMV